ncbi:MAG: patatin-like phospholipase family protein, partial [Candidatus Thermoplasmatota archaeon]|nr:patatin-like phospholipase family protein [Candidatus Thermoplasmatota archaeon]
NDEGNVKNSRLLGHSKNKEDIEEMTGERTSDLFDLVGGTSTGGLVALGLLKPDERGKPEFKAEDLLELYEKNGERIFHRSIWRMVESAWSLLDEKYNQKGIESVLDEYFGETRLKEALKPIIIPAYEIESRSVWFFRSERAKYSENYDFPMKIVARAASAAPTYFEPEKVKEHKDLDYWALIDGGVYANNPGMCAYVEAKTMFPDKDILIVSLGTGELTRRIDYKDARSWGLAQWAHPLLNVMFDGQSDTVDHQLKELLQLPGKGRRYFRFQTRLDSGNDNMDDPSEKNLSNLKVEAMDMLDRQRRDLETVCDLLIEK